MKGGKMMTNKLSEKEIEAIRKRAEMATEGPWQKDGAIDIHSPNGTEVAAAWGGYADQEFIAHAREDIPKLLAEIERLNAELVSYRQQEFERMCDDWYALANEEFEDKGVKIIEHERVGDSAWYTYYKVVFTYNELTYAFKYQDHKSANVCDLDIIEEIHEIRGDDE